MKLALALMLGLCAMSAAWAAGPARIALKESAIVTTRQTTLGDIAAIQAGDPETVQRLAAIPIAIAPLPGYTERLTREEVKRRVRARVPVMRDMLTWEGAAAVSVETSGTVVAGERLRRLAVGHATEALGRRFEHVEAHAAPLGDVMVVPGNASLRPREIDTAHGVARQIPVWIDIFVEGVFARAVAVPVDIEAFDTVRVARADLAADHVPQATDFETRRVDVARLGSDAVPAASGLAGKRITRAVKSGAVLVAADVQVRPAVARGETVTLRFLDEALLLEARAIALGEAAVGDAVWVKRESSGAPLRAQVVAPGTVEVSSR
jgi:flagella basal body P-ring formation protein FlgA